MRPTIEYWFDFSCPFAYLGSAVVEEMALRVNAKLILKPMLLGGIFRALAVPQNLAASVGASKARHNLNDMHRFARLWNVPFEMPSNHPIRTVNALRALLAAGEPYNKLMHAFFRAYWVDSVDVSKDENIAQILVDQGYDATAVMAKSQTVEIKSLLRELTDTALEKGIFGAPGLVVDGELYWGQDRIHTVESYLSGKEFEAPYEDTLDTPVEFYFDYSSPFAYLAFRRLRNFFGNTVTFRPMFLGGVWKAVNPRALAASENPAKFDYMGRDFRRQAAAAQIQQVWPNPFPLRTVLPLRVTLLSDCNRDLIEGFFHAYWVEGKDISQPETVKEICDIKGLNGQALIKEAQTDAEKKRLREVTQVAIDRGVFGAPTVIVPRQDDEFSLYWGSDRLWMAAQAARGDSRVF